jgi:hypothetical protein
MTDSKLTFDCLNDDVLKYMFTFFDIKSALNFSNTSTYNKNLVIKHPWNFSLLPIPYINVTKLKTYFPNMIGIFFGCSYEDNEIINIIHNMSNLSIIIIHNYRTGENEKLLELYQNIKYYKKTVDKSNIITMINNGYNRNKETTPYMILNINKELKKYSYNELNNLKLFNLNIEDIDSIKNIKNLNYLTISNTNITNNGIKDLINLKSLTYCCYLKHNKEYITNIGIKNLINLKQLTIQNNFKITDTVFNNLKNLTSLTLRNTQITNNGIKNLHNLTILNITEKIKGRPYDGYYISSYNDKINFSVIQHLNNLNILIGCKLNNDEINILKNKHIHVLDNKDKCILYYDRRNKFYYYDDFPIFNEINELYDY